MSALQTFIEDELDIPCIKEQQAVLDGSFIINPYYIGSLIGNGEAKSISVHYAVDLFYEDKDDAVSKGISLYKALLEEPGYCCDNPDFTFEEEANIWRTTLRVQEVENE